MTQFRQVCNTLLVLLLLATAFAVFVLYNVNELHATVQTTIRPLYISLQGNYSPEYDEPTVLTTIRSLYTPQDNHSPESNKPTVRTTIRPLYTTQGNYSPESDEPTRILYLTQTEECLPDHLRSALGNSSACQCDVVVLSYKNVCNDSTLPHVKYLFGHSTTWATGRNLLFTSNIHNTIGEYLYYIIMDDDIHLRWAQTTTGKNMDPWRTFEDFIRRVQPAVAGLEQWAPALKRRSEYRRRNNCYTEEEYFPTVWYDGAYSAFHYKAVEHLLPYRNQFDNVSWWCSSVFNQLWTDFLFRGHVVLHRDLIAFNPMHREYPRKRCFETVLPVFLKSVRERIPAECQNAPLLKEYETNGEKNAHGESSAYCLPPPPPKEAIVPFKNFVC